MTGDYSAVEVELLCVAEFLTRMAEGRPASVDVVVAEIRPAAQRG